MEHIQEWNCKEIQKKIDNYLASSKAVKYNDIFEDDSKQLAKNTLTKYLQNKLEIPCKNYYNEYPALRHIVKNTYGWSENKTNKVIFDFFDKSTCYMETVLNFKSDEMSEYKKDCSKILFDYEVLVKLLHKECDWNSLKIESVVAAFSTDALCDITTNEKIFPE